MPNKSPTPELDKLISAEPDLVDRIFDFLIALHPEIAPVAPETKKKVRSEFKGEQYYCAGRSPVERYETVQQVLHLFNGRNATEVARRLHISRATVYRVLKQPGRAQK